jgi:hypothetical protein
MLEIVDTIWLLLKIFLVITIFGFVKNWTGNTTISLVVAGILIYIFVIKYPLLGASYLVLANIFMIIIVLWVITLIIPK